MSGREEVIAACGQNGYALGRASAALRNDREVVLAACRQNGYALEHASVALRADREVVLVACGQCGGAIVYASAALRGDREVVLVVYRQYGFALKYASVAIQDELRQYVQSFHEHKKVLRPLVRRLLAHPGFRFIRVVKAIVRYTKEDKQYVAALAPQNMPLDRICDSDDIDEEMLPVPGPFLSYVMARRNSLTQPYVSVYFPFNSEKKAKGICLYTLNRINF